MDTPFNASASPVGTLISANTFVVAQFQREYAWESDEVREFWTDLCGGLAEGTYFLGLVILTDEESSKHVVDGQQRILTVTLLAAALFHEAVRAGRKALADRIQSDFLTSVNYQTDEIEPRVRLSDDRDDRTLQSIISDAGDLRPQATADDDFAARLVSASNDLRHYLRDDLTEDPFRRLGVWTDFLTNYVYLAVFVHPDPASAYRVFEVINTRGRELTTADLLKNYILSQTPTAEREARYKEWQSISRSLTQTGQGSLVQYIRHVVTLSAGHVLPRDLFAFLADRPGVARDRLRPPSTPELMVMLNERLPLYLQMNDPTLEGPAEADWLGVFSALQDLNVIAVRPLLMAIADVPDATTGMRRVLELVVRRIVVGNLGTGNVERRLSEAARRIVSGGSWEEPLAELEDLNPSRNEFIEQLRKRSFNKGSLTFLRRSLVQRSPTPERIGSLHLVRPRQAFDWEGFPDEDFSYWGSTIGNTFLASVERRPKGAASFAGFLSTLLPKAAPGEDRTAFSRHTEWSTEAVELRGRELADGAAGVWFS